jgi:hypothetical protein
MAYAFYMDVPIDEAIYERIRRKLGDVPPKGLIMHLVVKREGGLRYINVWESKAHFEDAFDGIIHEKVHETFEEIGYQPPSEHADPPHPYDIVHLWTPLVTNASSM